MEECIHSVLVKNSNTSSNLDQMVEWIHSLREGKPDLLNKVFVGSHHLTHTHTDKKTKQNIKGEMIKYTQVNNL